MESNKIFAQSCRRNHWRFPLARSSQQPLAWLQGSKQMLFGGTITQSFTAACELAGQPKDSLASTACSARQLAGSSR
jgi:hypothetical protein